MGSRLPLSTQERSEAGGEDFGGELRQAGDYTGEDAEHEHQDRGDAEGEAEGRRKLHPAERDPGRSNRAPDRTCTDTTTFE